MNSRTEKSSSGKDSAAFFLSEPCDETSSYANEFNALDYKFYEEFLKCNKLFKIEITNFLTEKKPSLLTPAYTVLIF